MKFAIESFFLGYAVALSITTLNAILLGEKLPLIAVLYTGLVWATFYLMRIRNERER